MSRDGRSAMTPTTVHNASTYSNYRCRCGVCRADHAAVTYRRRQVRRQYLRSQRGRLVTTADVHHGRSATYQNWFCRCVPCTQATRRDRRDRRQRTREAAS